MVDDVCLRCKVSMWALVCATVVYAAESEHPVLGQVSSMPRSPRGNCPYSWVCLKWFFIFPMENPPRLGNRLSECFFNFGRTPNQQIQVLLEDSLWNSVAGKLMRYFSHFDTCFDAHMDNQHVLARTRRTSWTKLPGVCNSLLVKITMFYVYFSNMFYGNSSNESMIVHIHRHFFQGNHPSKLPLCLRPPWSKREDWCTGHGLCLHSSSLFQQRCSHVLPPCYGQYQHDMIIYLVVGNTQDPLVKMSQIP